MPVDWTKEISASLSCCTASTKSDRILFVLQKCLREREREREFCECVCVHEFLSESFQRLFENMFVSLHTAMMSTLCNASLPGNCESCITHHTHVHASTHIYIVRLCETCASVHLCVRVGATLRRCVADSVGVSVLACVTVCATVCVRMVSLSISICLRVSVHNAYSICTSNA